VNTATGQVLGTVGYMAPEQASSGKDVDARADIFSLGCVLFECLTGRPPFEGDSAMAVLGRILLDHVPRVSDFQAGVPPSLDELVRKMMSKDAASRPPLGVVIVELEALGSLRGLRSVARDEHGARGPTALSTDEARQLFAIVGRDAVGGPVNSSDHPTLTYAQVRGEDEVLVAHVTAAGGRFERRMDGVPIAVFPEGERASDVAAQVARCALAVRARWRSSVLAVVHGPANPTGDMPAPTTVARMYGALQAFPDRGARVATVLVDDGVAALVGDRFTLRRSAAGIELVAERPRSLRALVEEAGPFVGREREARLVEDIADEALGDAVATVALVTAEAGAGKTRLAAEVARRLTARGVTLWEGAGQVGVAAPLSTLSGLVASIVGPAPEAGWSAATLRARLAELVGAAADREALASLFGDALGLPAMLDERLQAAPTEAGFVSERARLAWERFVVATATAGPLAIVVDDLQWADLSSLSLLDQALHAAEELPLVVLALARPAAREVVSSLWPARRVREVRLLPLPSKSAERLVASELGPGADPAVVGRVVQRGCGLPLYLTQLARAGGRVGTPPAVLSAARASLSALSVEERRVLRAASIFGESFWSGGVRALLGGDDARAMVEHALGSLRERGLVERRATSRFSDEEEHGFAQAILRDAAYAALTERDRELGHKLAADWLEASGERDALALAGHFERGGEPRRAVVWYLWATEQAFERNELETVVAHAERGVDCDASGAVLGELRLLQAEALGWSGGASRQGDLAQAAMKLLPEGTGAWCRAAAQLVLACARQGDRAGLRDAATALGTMQPGASAGVGPWLAALRGLVELYVDGEGELAATLAAKLEAVAPTDDADRTVLAAARTWLSAAQARGAGDPALYVREGEAIAATLEAEGHRRYAILVEVERARALRLAGDREAALTVAERALAAAKELHLEEIADRIRALLGRLLPPPRALEAARHALDDGVTRGDRVTEGWARATIARLLLDAGDVEGATREATLVATSPVFPLDAIADARETAARLPAQAART